MKNIRLNTFLILSSFLILSCTQEFLDEEPLTQLNNENFYNTPQDVEDAVIGCYDGMQRAVVGVAGLSYPVASMVLSDNFYGGGGAADPFGFQAVDEFDPNRAPAEQNLFEPLWTAYYQGIFRCNSLLQGMEQVNWEESDNPELRQVYESEAKMIRAYLYFQMVQMWENIPLLIEPSEENLPQADPDEVYTVIAEDLAFAAENLPADSYSSVQAGRITRWAAKSLLARVYLYYTGYYNQQDLVGVVNQQQALQHLEDVIASSGHSLLSDFSTLWPAASVENFAGENNAEIVFSVKATYTSVYGDGTTTTPVDGNHWMVMLGMREFTYYPYGNGWGVTATEGAYNTFQNNDTRRDASIIAVEEQGIPFDQVTNQREYTGYYTKKYTPMSNEDGTSTAVALGGADFQIGQYQDFYVIRYADVLLMAAELGSGSAQDYFDQVRSRAYGDNFSSVAFTQEALDNERRLEFALEGIRYWDLLRRGVDEAAQVIATSTTLLNGGAQVQKTIEASRIQQTRGLQQIPNNQITLSNGVLIQNEGW